MIRFLIVMSSCIVTLIISLISTPIAGLLFSITISGTIGYVIKQKAIKLMIIFTSQYISYSIADFCGLILGALILRKSGNLKFMPALYIMVILSSFSYMLQKYSFASMEAHMYNKIQKFTSLIGTITAIALIYFMVSRW